MQSPPTRDAVIWITEAMVTYRRSRDWFTRRIQQGRLQRIGLPGESQAYLLRAELERVLREDAGGGRGSSHRGCVSVSGE
ncbi:MAG: hypothetical protein ACRDHP_14000 [Ktedonobacterales bacterium]